MIAAIEVRNLTKRYGAITAVEGLSMTVPSGSLFGFLGPNGSGKSTTVACLSGLIDPSAGEILVLGKSANPFPTDLKRKIGVLPENLGLFDELYADEFLVFQGMLCGLDEETALSRTKALLDRLGLADSARSSVGDFSSGMRKKVAFAAAIIHDPDLLFLDEPFESIDPQGVAMMKDWLRAIVAKGKTVFLTTHVLEVAEHLCSHIEIISKPGRSLWRGPLPTRLDLTPIVVGEQEHSSLESLFLAISGSAAGDLEWLR